LTTQLFAGDPLLFASLLADRKGLSHACAFREALAALGVACQTRPLANADCAYTCDQQNQETKPDDDFFVGGHFFSPSILKNRQANVIFDQEITFADD
jgi:hypothetical protein